jgi:hypothetical protein
MLPPAFDQARLHGSPPTTSPLAVVDCGIGCYLVGARDAGGGTVMSGERTHSLHGPENYFGIAPEYWLWIWPRDLNEAIGRLNLVPSPGLVGAQ